MLELPYEKMDLMDELGNQGLPFLFVINFDGSEVCVWREEEVPPYIRFSVPLKRQSDDEPAEGTFPGGDAGGNGGRAGRATMATTPSEDDFVIVKPSFKAYSDAFNRVMHHLQRGDTYLINLTMPTLLDSSLTPEQIYMLSSAPYRFLWRDRFVCFSPEIFVRIDDGVISSYPMKGTIDASVPNARETILADRKEFAEHNTIVDLIRNDLSMVAEEVRVKRYRYIDEVVSRQRTLLQVSSEINGRLPAGTERSIGTIMSRLLPAGSVTGAPKKKTVAILKSVEGYDRGFYTGVFGYFDGRRLDSGVMIRFIESRGGRLCYKSGGGITAMSNLKDEYDELIKKIYLPFL